jgi:hypothetical protein
VCVLCITVYFLALRFLFPGYVHPLAPFHGDFYDYTGIASLHLGDVLKYPRPAAFAVMWVLGHLGLRGLMAAGICLVLCGVALTIALAARLIACEPLRLLFFTVVYLFLLFAQPQFYFEHRHDLPAEVSYLGLMLALHAWLWWVRSRRMAALVCAFAAVLLFAFAKETFFLSAPCLLFGLVLYDRERWRAHLSFLVALLVMEAASVWWNRHLGTPFVNPGAAAADPYNISLAPGSIVKLYWHYFRHLLMPAAAALLALSVLVIARSRLRNAIVAIAFAAAGLAALIPHSLLPNHVIDEYAWIPAPLLFIPLLMAAAARLSRQNFGRLSAAILVLSTLTLVGHYGYLHDYRSAGLRWYVSQEKHAANFMQSWPSLRALPSGSRVLVAGLDTPFFPWSSVQFTERTFGSGKIWRVLVKEVPPNAPPSWIISFRQAAEFLKQSPQAFDYAVSYDEPGNLKAIRNRAELQRLTEAPWVVVPQLAAVRYDLAAHPKNRFAIIAALAEAANWNDQQTGELALAEAQETAISGDRWVCFFRGKLAALRGDWGDAASGFRCASSQEPKAAIFRDALNTALSHVSGSGTPTRR